MQDNMMLRKLVSCLHMSLGLWSRVKRLCKVIHTSLLQDNNDNHPLYQATTATHSCLVTFVEWLGVCFAIKHKVEVSQFNAR